MAKYTLKVLSGTKPEAKHVYDRTDFKPYNLTATADTIGEGIKSLLLRIWMNSALQPRKILEKVVKEDHGIGSVGQYLITTRGPSGTAIRYTVSVYNFGRGTQSVIEYTQTDGKGKFYTTKF